MSEYQKKLALKLEIARAIPGACEAVVERIYQNRAAVLSGYDLHEDGSITSIGGGSIKDEVEAMRQSGAYDDLFREGTKPAAPAADDRKYPGNRTLAEVQAIKDPQERLQVLAEGEGKSPVIGNESWRKTIPANAGVSSEALAKMSPLEKIAAANEATAKAQGWDYSGWGRDR